MWRKKNRYRKPWYGYIACVCLANYGSGKMIRGVSEQDDKMIEAIEKAIAETAKLEDGERILELIKRVYMDRTQKLSQAAQELYFSERTAQKLASEFVYRVGHNAKYDCY